MKPLLILIRHGATTMNDPDNERLRGWLPVHLTDEGAVQASENGYTLLNYNVRNIYFSPIARTEETAHIIHATMWYFGDAPDLVPESALATWKLGELEGRPVEEILPAMLGMYRDKTMAPAGGESYGEFRKRYINSLVRLMGEAQADPSHAVVAVCHTANFRLTDAWLSAGAKGYETDDAVLADPAYSEMKPGSMMFLTWDDRGARIVLDEEAQAAHQGGPQGPQKPAMDVPETSPAPAPPNPGGAGNQPTENFMDDRFYPASGAYPRAPGDKPQPYLAYQSFQAYLDANGRCPVCDRPFDEHSSGELGKCEAAYTGLKDVPENYSRPEGPVAQ